MGSILTFPEKKSSWLIFLTLSKKVYADNQMGRVLLVRGTLIPKEVRLIEKVKNIR